MSKLVSSKEINAVFLATVIVVGTFALMYPSFMTSAQALEMNNNFQEIIRKRFQHKM